MVLGVGISKIALIRSLPSRMPSDDKTCPKYFTSFGPNCTFEGFKVSPAAWRAWKVFSSRSMCPSHVDEQQMMSSMYTRRPDFGPKLANASAMVRWNRKGALAIPKGSRLKTHFPFLVTKAVFDCSDSATGI